jgi:hypothetical protein
MECLEQLMKLDPEYEDAKVLLERVKESAAERR